MPGIKDLTGKRFKRLIVVGLSHKNPKEKNLAYWRCLCDCGNEIIVRGISLSSGATKSCGCWAKEVATKRIIEENKKRTLPIGTAASNSLFAAYKKGAKHRNLCFELPKTLFLELTSSTCFYCGRPPNQSRSEKRFNGVYLHNGIDRVDSSKGYEKDNCVPCCKHCNVAKMGQTQEAFFIMIKTIYEKHDLGNAEALLYLQAQGFKL